MNLDEITFIIKTGKFAHYDVHDEICKSEHMNFVDPLGVTPLLAFVLNSHYKSYKSMFKDCLEKSSEETILHKHEGFNVLHYAIKENLFDYFSLLIKNDKLRLAENYSRFVDEKLSYPEWNYVMQCFETPDISEELLAFESAVYKNDCKAADKILSEMSKKHNLNDLLDSDSVFLSALITDEIKSLNMLKVFEKYFDFSHECYFGCYDERMSLYDYFKKSSEDVIEVHPEVRKKYALFVDHLKDKMNKKNELVL